MKNDNVEKRCECAEAKWPKCAHPWYLKKFRFRGKPYEPNLTRLAAVENKTIKAKTEAEEFAETVRSSIRLGTYVAAKVANAAQPKADAGLLLGMPDTVDKHSGAVTPGSGVLTLFDAEVLRGGDVEKRATTIANDRACVRKFAEFEPDAKRGALATWPIVDITTAIVVAFRRGPVLAGRANSTWNKYRSLLTQLFAWSTVNGYTTADPFKSLQPQQARALKRAKGASRHRRVDVVEEAALIRAAGRARGDAVATRLASLILAAIETGMRLGELLALQWADVDMVGRMIYVRAVEIGASKTKEPRPVPMSQRLHDELETLRLDPNGEPFSRSCYVFGDAIGGRIKSIKKAWETAILYAHGVTPTWSKTGRSLLPASRAELRRIALHFHDLRHEAGSRWLESKLFDLGEIQVIYGHTTVAQTSKYLHVKAGSASAAMARLDSARAALAKADKAAAVGAAETVQSGDKLSANAKTSDRAVAKPRLVKSDKSRGEL